MKSKLTEIFEFIGNRKNLRYNLLVILVGLTIGIFAWDWAHFGQLLRILRLTKLSASELFILVAYLLGGAAFTCLLWVVYSLSLSRITNSDTHDTLARDAVSYLPVFILLAFPLKYLISMPTEYAQMRLPSAILITLAVSGAVALKVLFVDSDLRELRTRFPLSSTRNGIIVSVFIVCYVLIFGILASLKYNAHNLAFETLGHMSQVAWGTLHGGRTVVARWWAHVDPITAVFSPFYFIFSDVQVLLWGQTILIALGALPVYWLARDILKSNLAGLFFAGSYLLYPSVQYINLMDFYPEQLTVCFFLFAFYFIFKRKYIFAFIFLFLAMMCKEYISLIVFFVGLYVIFKQKDQKVGTGISAMGLLWFYIALWVIIPHFNKELNTSPFYSMYAHLGNGFFGIMKGIILHPIYALKLVLMPAKLGSMFLLFLPVGFLCLLYPRVLLLAIPTFAIILLNRSLTTSTINQHYISSIIPFVFVSAIYASRYLVEKLDSLYSRFKSRVPYNFPQNALYSVVSFMLLCSILSNYFYSPSPVSRLYLPKTYQVTQRDKMINKIIRETIPKEASVVAPNNIAPHLAQRSKIYRFPDYYPEMGPFPNPQFMVIDLYAPTPHYSGTYMSFDERVKLIGKLIQEETYNLVAYQDRLAIFQRDGKRDNQLDNFALADLPQLTEQPDVDFDGRIILLNHEIERPKTELGDKIELICYWQVLDRFLTKEEIKLRLELIGEDDAVMLSKQLPFAKQEWEKWMVFRERYSIVSPDREVDYKIRVSVFVVPEGKELRVREHDETDIWVILDEK